MEKLTSLKKFLFTAYYDWLLENEVTPHLLVDATYPNVQVPTEYVSEGKIILSLLPAAIADYQCKHNGISFKARFKGTSRDIFIPFGAMEQLISIETGSALPIGAALEQLDLSPDDEDVYPDEGEEDNSPNFELDDDSDEQDHSDDMPIMDNSNAIDSTPKESQEKKESKEPGFSFVDE